VHFMIRVVFSITMSVFLGARGDFYKILGKFKNFLISYRYSENRVQ
jgi:hypothetical protein